MSEEVKGFVDPYAKIAEWVQDKPQGDRYEPLLTKDYKEIAASPEPVLEAYESKNIADIKIVKKLVNKVLDFADDFSQGDTSEVDSMVSILHKAIKILDRLENS